MSVEISRRKERTGKDGYLMHGVVECDLRHPGAYQGNLVVVEGKAVKDDWDQDGRRVGGAEK